MVSNGRGKNPFRTPNITPNPTGLSIPQANSPSFADTPETGIPTIPTAGPSAALNPSPIAENSAGATANSTYHPETTTDPIGLTEDAPPAYTPAADPYQGEATIEYGPRRPFQQPPPQPPLPQQQYLSPNPTGLSRPSQPPQSFWQQLTGQLLTEFGNQSNRYPRSSSAGAHSGTGWSSYPGHQSPAPPLRSQNSSIPLPPPRHPSSRAHSSSPPHTTRPSSDFARDFYAAGAVPLNIDTGDASNSTSVYTPPPGAPPPTQEPQYRPPIGAPPSPTRNKDLVPDDGRPTKTPMVGHPLLHDGKLLVYPSGYECDKCHNVGYKHSDPSNPCTKCWSKYAKPFTGALVYTPWSSSSGSSSTSRTTFQRPLSVFRPPQLPPAPQRLQRSQSHHAAPSHFRAQSQPINSPSSQFAPPPRALYAPSYGPPPNVRQISPYTPAPRGAPVYPPGDARIGGRLCWRCGGDGTVSFFIFDIDTCPVCEGIGRVFG